MHKIAGLKSPWVEFATSFALDFRDDRTNAHPCKPFNANREQRVPSLP